MLVLTRRIFNPATQPNDKSRIVIRKGGEVIGTLQLLMATKGTGRIGFEFDADYEIKREEIDNCKGNGAQCTT